MQYLIDELNKFLKTVKSKSFTHIWGIGQIGIQIILSFF